MASDLRAMIFDVDLDKPAGKRGWGWIGLVASERGLRLVTLPAQTNDAASLAVSQYYPGVAEIEDDPFLCTVADQLSAYLSDDLREFSVELDLRGNTPFAVSVWITANRIPYGQTRTYAWVADEVAGSGAAQAAGAALGANPIPLIIPCHRVIGSDGSLHGYAGGLDMKARLLALESGQGTLGLI
jgi:methylated-DNA-[protein]-cysteine S-methyltransferase